MAEGGDLCYDVHTYNIYLACTDSYLVVCDILCLFTSSGLLNRSNCGHPSPREHTTPASLLFPYSKLTCPSTPGYTSPLASLVGSGTPEDSRTYVTSNCTQISYFMSNCTQFPVVQRRLFSCNRNKRVSSSSQQMDLTSISKSGQE